MVRIWVQALFVAVLALAGFERAQAQQAEPPSAESQGSAGAEAVRPDASPVAPADNTEDVIAQWLAQAKDQVARLALTTPAGDNAYETYLRVLFLQPKNQAALDGIEQIGIAYAALAKLAAAKGNIETANLYARKAAILAPEHPSVLSMPTPFAARETRADEPPGAAKAEVAAAPPGDAKPEGLIENADDLVFAPHDYQGRQVVVTGAVVHLLWNYRLKAATGQNSLVIDVSALSETDRAKLKSALDGAGFLGQVRARISGRIERQSLATFELAAKELTLDLADSRTQDKLAPALPANPDEATPLVVNLSPREPFGRTNGDRNGPGGDRGRESASRGGGGGTGGSGGGGSGDGGSGSDGDGGGGNSGGGNSGGGNSGGGGNNGGGGNGNGGGDDGGGGDGGGDDGGGNGNEGGGNGGPGNGTQGRDG